MAQGNSCCCVPWGRHCFTIELIVGKLQTGKKCPECRFPCTSDRLIVRLFLKQDSQQSQADATISDAAAEYAEPWIEKLRAKTVECNQKQQELDDGTAKLEASDQRIKSLERNCAKLIGDLETNKERLKYFANFKRDLEKSQAEMERLQKEARNWKEEAEKLQRFVSSSVH